jgi:mRNA interferase RelE/StbE
LKVEFKRSFVRDLERVRDKRLKEQVKETIERIEKAQTLQEIENVKKLRGGERYCRIRIGDYRLGLVLEGNTGLCPIFAPEGCLQVLSITEGRYGNLSYFCFAIATCLTTVRWIFLRLWRNAWRPGRIETRFLQENGFLWAQLWLKGL